MLSFVGCSSPSSQDTAADKHVWHDDCPTEEREQRMINVGDLSLNVACRGSGPTVVFLHGFPEFHYAWNKVMDELSDEFRLIAPDQRGYNLSDKPEAVEAYTLDLLTGDILNLLPIISSEPVILVAHDWGGPVGWMVAHHPEAHIRAFLSTNGPHPMRFAELIESDPAQQEASSYMDFFRQEGSESFFTESALQSMFSDVLSNDELEIYNEAWAQSGAITGGLNWYRANSLVPSDVERLMADFSPTVSVPTTVMWGLDDDAVLASNAEGLEPYAPDLELKTYPDVDHWIEHHIPDEVAASVRELHLRAQ